MKYIKLNKNDLKKGDILVPNGKTKQSCKKKFIGKDLQVKFVEIRHWGNEIRVKIIKGHVKDCYNGWLEHPGETIIVNLNHFKLLNNDSYEIY